MVGITLLICQPVGTATAIGGGGRDEREEAGETGEARDVSAELFPNGKQR